MASVMQNRFGKLLGSKAFVGPMVGKIGGSESYLAEQLTVKATVENEYGESVSATRTTNFTVVKVDVAIGGVGEDREETEGAFVQYVPDAPGGLWTSEVTQSVVRVSITCERNSPLTKWCPSPRRKGLSMRGSTVKTMQCPWSSTSDESLIAGS